MTSAYYTHIASLHDPAACDGLQVSVSHEGGGASGSAVLSGDGAIDVVCPCYNPPKGFIDDLHSSMERLRAMYPRRRMRLIVVNDGSTRGFGPLERAGLLRSVPDTEIVDIPHAGKGAAIRAGIAGSEAPFVIYTDIDMPYVPESMRQVIESVIAGYDVVIAVRNRSYRSRLSLLRKAMSYGSKALNRIFLNIPYTDTQGGLKGLSSITIYANHYRNSNPLSN